MNFNIRDKVVSYLNLVTNSMSNLQSPVMWVVMLYAVIIALGIIVYLVSWIYLAYFGKIDLKSLLDFIHELVSSPFVLCITFIGGCLIDMNGNGVPDSIEGKLDPNYIKKLTKSDDTVKVDDCTYADTSNEMCIPPKAEDTK